MKPTKPKVKKSPPCWYCPKREFAGYPMVWHRFPGPKGQPGIPIDGALIMASTPGFRGLVIRVPKGSIDNTVAFLRKHSVRWWSYMPALPAILDAVPKQPITVENFAHNTGWVISADHVRSIAQISVATLQMIADGKTKNARKDARDALEFVREFRAHHGTDPLNAEFDA